MTNNVVNDVHRYTAIIKDRRLEQLIWNTTTDFPCSNYFDLRPFVADKSIVVILESPHRDEFCYKRNGIMPIAPAQGVTGANIERIFKEHLKIAVQKGFLNDGEYPAIIANPVPWQASLWFFYRYREGINGKDKVKNVIWDALWNHPLVINDFKRRLSSYHPCLIYNSCTVKRADWEKKPDAQKSFHYTLRWFLSTDYKDIVINTYHPAISYYYAKMESNIYPTISFDIQHRQ